MDASEFIPSVEWLGLRFLEEDGKEKSNNESDRHFVAPFFGVICYPVVNSDNISIWNNYNGGVYNA